MDGLTVMATAICGPKRPARASRVLGASAWRDAHASPCPSPLMGSPLCATQERWRIGMIREGSSMSTSVKEIAWQRTQDELVMREADEELAGVFIEQQLQRELSDQEKEDLRLKTIVPRIP